MGSDINLVEGEALKFKIGDMVDGMCTLSNGSTRWFPGVIEEGRGR